MYCSECGTKNDSPAVYCVNDGYPLRPAELTGTLEMKQNGLCGNCGANNQQAAVYCNACGTALDTYEERDEAGTADTPFNLKLVIKILPGLGLAIGLLLLISQLISSSEPIRALFGMIFPSPVREKLDTLDYFLFSNMVSFSARTGNDQVTQYMSYDSIGMIVFIFPVIICLMAGGFLVKLLYRRVSEWKAAVLLGAGYAAFLGVIASLSGTSAEVAGTFQFSFRFNTGSAVYNGFFLGALFSYAGMMQQSSPLRRTKSFRMFQRPVYYGVYTFLAGFAAAMIINLILFFQFEPEVNHFLHVATTPEKIAFVTRLATYLFNFALFNTFMFQAHGEDSSYFSFIEKTLPSAQDNLQLFIPVDYFESYEILSMCALAVVFIIAGRMLAGLGSRDIVPAVIYSLSFACVMTFASYFATFDYSLQSDDFPEGLIRFLAGFDMVKTFIISFVYAGVTSTIGILSKKLI